MPFPTNQAKQRHYTRFFHFVSIHTTKFSQYSGKKKEAKASTIKHQTEKNRQHISARKGFTQDEIPRTRSRANKPAPTAPAFSPNLESFISVSLLTRFNEYFFMALLIGSRI